MLKDFDPDNQYNRKMVFLVRDILLNTLVILKLYHIEEVYDRLMEVEVGKNSELINHPLIIKMTSHTYPSDVPMQVFERKGEQMESYGYILVPFC